MTINKDTDDLLGSALDALNENLKKTKGYERALYAVAWAFVVGAGTVCEELAALREEQRKINELTRKVLEKR